MNKIFLILLIPVFVNAQKPIENKSKDSIVVKNESIFEPTPRQLIEGYRQRVIKGEKMSDLARKYSQDPGSAKDGGMYLNVAKGTMVPQFEVVAFSLKAGEISEVFETQYGFHFIQLLSNHGETVDLRHLLIMFK